MKETTAYRCAICTEFTEGTSKVCSHCGNVHPHPVHMLPCCTVGKVSCVSENGTLHICSLVPIEQVEDKPVINLRDIIDGNPNPFSKGYFDACTTHDTIDLISRRMGGVLPEGKPYMVGLPAKFDFPELIFPKIPQEKLDAIRKSFEDIGNTASKLYPIVEVPAKPINCDVLTRKQYDELLKSGVLESMNGETRTYCEYHDIPDAEAATTKIYRLIGNARVLREGTTNWDDMLQTDIVKILNEYGMTVTMKQETYDPMGYDD